VLPQPATQQFLAGNQPGAPVLRAFTAGVTPGFLASALALDVAPGDGNRMWFTDFQTPAIGTIGPNGIVHEYTGLPVQSRPYSIVGSGNGVAWFTDRGTASVGRIDESGNIREFTDADLAGTYPAGIAIAPGNAVWFISVSQRSLLAHVSQSGTITAYPLAPDLSPDGSLVADNAGNLWLLAVNSIGKTVIVERRSNGTTTRYHTNLQPAFEPCCPNLALKRMTLGPDGNIWFTTLDYILGNSPANWIGVVTPAGAQRYYWVRNGRIGYPTYPSGITSAYGRVWFTGDDPFANISGLWSMTAPPAMTPYAVPYNPIGIAAGRDRHLWFTSHFGGQPSQIVEVTLTP
jgi:streptogramin lyase